MYAKAGSPMKQEKGMVRKWVNHTGLKNPNDFHPSPSYENHIQFENNEETLSQKSKVARSKPLIKNSAKLQNYKEMEEEGSQTPPGNDEDELG